MARMKKSQLYHVSRIGGERGAALVAALFVVTILSILGVIFLVVAGTEHTIASNALLSESALSAAEATVHIKMVQMEQTLSAPNVSAIGPITLVGNIQFRTGTPTSGAAAADLMGPCAPPAGFGLSGPSGFGCARYRVTGTGTGPRGTVQGIEAEVGLIVPLSTS